MAVPVTALYAASCGLLLLVLSGRVVLVRRRTRVGLGTGGEVSLEHAMRVQANLAEYMPIAIILLLTLELNSAPPAVLHSLGGGFLLGRLMHAWGFARHSGVSFGRFWGTALSWIALLALAIANLYRLI
jgi:uncharacterized membrane protein YecN with MAPEG domain